MPTIEQRNKAAARRIIEDVIGTADFDLAKQLIADDFRNLRTGLQGAVQALGVQRSIRGDAASSLDGFMNGLQVIRRSFPDWHHTVNLLIAEGDLVMGTWTLSATFSGDPFLGFNSNGKNVTKDEAGVLRFKDGKLQEFWGLSDSLEFVLSLGARLQT
ncbi:ester cyclase [Cupriavidus necator]|uniref:ester cyclase n=1 Tax=Cupriavidus necator TaxID=106590 RepID=UPI00059D031B|nr:ester cyclase [Cupriavidus necator]MDX6007642.1 ester cyclase [Cupriavidus necator]